MKKITDISIFKKQKMLVAEQLGRLQISYSAHGDHGDSAEIHNIGNELRKNILQQPLCCCYWGCFLHEHQPFFQRRLRQLNFTIEYIQEGELALCCGGKGFLAEAGEVYFTYPGSNNSILYTPGKRCIRYGLVLTGAALTDMLRLFKLDSVDWLRLSDVEGVQCVLDRMRQNFSDLKNIRDCRKLIADSFELLQLFHEELKENSQPPVEKIRLMLERRFAEKLSMKEIAGAFEMSLPAFNRCFHEAYALTPYQYLIQYRMHYAAHLMKSCDLRIKEVAFRCGYTSQLHFSNQFRLFHNMTPTEYRNRSC